MKHTVDLNYFPGWVRKSITFSIDDGNLVLDRKFLDIVKPAGLLGTFNLMGTKGGHSDEEYRALYRGMGIGNHEYRHAHAFTEERRAMVCDEIFPGADLADPTRVYKTAEPGVYRIRTYAWCYVVEDEVYLEYARIVNDRLYEVFGEEATRDFIWPCGRQQNEEVFSRLKKVFRSIRKTGNVGDSTNFDMPHDRMEWSYNANYTCMSEFGEKYEQYGDDGRLKFFCFGVHSHDFERAGRWDVLEDFARKYGNRPEDFYYAPVGVLFDYEDATRAVEITDEGIYNPTEIDLYIKIDGERKMLRAKSKINF